MPRGVLLPGYRVTRTIADFAHRDGGFMPEGGSGVYEVRADSGDAAAHDGVFAVKFQRLRGLGDGLIGGDSRGSGARPTVVIDDETMSNTTADAARLAREIGVMHLLQDLMTKPKYAPLQRVFLRVHDAHVTDGGDGDEGNENVLGVCIVMQLARGGNLGSVLRHRPETITIHHVDWIGYNLMLQLTVLHGLGVAHRDVKPDNFFVESSQDQDGPWLADFGHARRIAEVPSVDAQRRKWAVADYSSYVCTRGYRAPELLLAAEAYGLAIDVWSAGSILAECIMRRPLLSIDATSSPAPLMAVKEMLTWLCSTTDLRRLMCEESGGGVPWSKLRVPRHSCEALRALAEEELERRSDNNSLLSGADPDAVPLHAQIIAAGATDELAVLVVAMLSFDPSARPTARDALRHAAWTEPFDRVEVEAAEAIASDEDARRWAQHRCGAPSCFDSPLAARRAVIEAVTKLRVALSGQPPAAAASDHADDAGSREREGSCCSSM
jgi:serine/threonine protein kinase